jgi:hypothetical protein
MLVTASCLYIPDNTREASSAPRSKFDTLSSWRGASSDSGSKRPALHTNTNRVPGDRRGIVGLDGGAELKNRIIVHKVEQFFRAKDESQDDLSRFVVPARAGENAGFNQGNHTV